jgi:hypothetical protein
VDWGVVWTFGNNAGSQNKVKIKGIFTAVPEFSWLWRKLNSKFSVLQCGQIECCTDLPARFPIKEIPGQLVLSLQPAIDNTTPLVNTI